MKKKQFEALYRLLWAVGFAFLYSWGGMEYKWLRRFIAPLWLGGGLYLFSKNWKCLFQVPLMMFSLSMGYGADLFWHKVIRRGLFGLANGITSSAYNIYRKKWILMNIHIILCVSLYIVIGVKNPFLHARTEEMLLGFIIAFVPIMSMEKND